MAVGVADLLWSLHFGCLYFRAGYTLGLRLSGIVLLGMGMERVWYFGNVESFSYSDKYEMNVTRQSVNDPPIKRRPVFVHSEGRCTGASCTVVSYRR
eukprot:3790612-Prymnesium_polylepis.3